MIITNLFSMFDPTSPNFFSSNWIVLLSVFFIIPFKIWILTSRITFLKKTLYSWLFREFQPLLHKFPYLLLTSLTFFTLISSSNLLGLTPYVFTPTRHIRITLSLALTRWTALAAYGWFNNTNNLLAHLIPQRTPTILMPFIVLIEITRNLIRPLTLAVRLAANIIAGHLLLSLIRSALAKSPLSFFLVILLPQTALRLLELAVAFLQAYVFRVLITLYLAEATS